jgi:Sulfotransferase domain
MAMISALSNGLQRVKTAYIHTQNPYRDHWLWSKKVPLNYTPQDIFLVSYPKSGNTYLRFLIGNAIKLQYGLQREVNFFTIQDIVPNITDGYLRETGPFGQQDLPRIIKSHHAYNPQYMRVILLVRDPRDVLTSFYYHRKNYNRLPQTTTMAEFIRHPVDGAKVWADHTRSWYLCEQMLERNIQLFRYEDFMQDPQSSLLRLMGFIGLEMQAELVNQAVDLSSKEKMRQSEALSASTYQFRTQKTQFVRQGEVKGGAGLAAVDQQFIEDQTRKIAQLVGYDF